MAIPSAGVPVAPSEFALADIESEQYLDQATGTRGAGQNPSRIEAHTNGLSILCGSQRHRLGGNQEADATTNHTDMVTGGNDLTRTQQRQRNWLPDSDWP